MSWRDTEIGLILDATSGEIQTGPFGTQLKASEYQEDGIPVINVRNIGYGDLRPDKLEYVGEIKADKLKAHRLEKDDIVFGRKGAVDRHLLVSERQIGWIQGSDCIRLRLDPESALPKFVSYALLRETHKKWILAQSGNKATMASLNHDIIRRIPISLPDLPTQQRIAGILSAYDDLIENNRRRIGLLEQAARLLYREWFVHLRFPGHETAKIVDGLPEGWTQTTVFDAVDVLSGGTPKTDNAEYWGDQIPFFTPKDTGEFPYVNDTEKMITEAGLKNCNSRLYEKDTLFITARGTVGKLRLAQRPMAMNQSCYALRSKCKLTQHHLFFAISDRVNHLKAQAGGAVFAAIVVDTFKKIPLLIPSDELAEEFARFASNALAQIDALAQQNAKLTSARDLLLPRLMDGRIPV